MRSQWVFVVEGILLWTILTPAAMAQRGVGDNVGVAQQAVKPEVVQFSGTVKAIVTEPCELTTGRSTTGTHVVLTKNGEGELNVHLGPASSVEFATAKLVVGQDVTVDAFRTEKMKQNHYVAQSLTADGGTVQLRDQNLQPLWANAGLRGTWGGTRPKRRQRSRVGERPRTWSRLRFWLRQRCRCRGATPAADPEEDVDAVPDVPACSPLPERTTPS